MKLMELRVALFQERMFLHMKKLNMEIHQQKRSKWFQMKIMKSLGLRLMEMNISLLKMLMVHTQCLCLQI